MTMNLKSWGLLTLALVLPSCLLDFDGYRERPADGGGNGGNGAAGNAGGNGGTANGASGGSGNAGGSGGAAAGGSGGDAGSGNGGSGNAAGNGGSGAAGGDAGSGGSGASCSQSVSDVACNDCLHANCCAELEACAPGSQCSKTLNCMAETCWDAADFGTCSQACYDLPDGDFDTWSELFVCACNLSGTPCRAACQRTVGCGAPSSNAH